ncbi:hypothetical protein CSHISOI_08343 [Colletotrichum shisoi]|uniref:Aminoglycoside phosphotransferase domain-containing protein n=1 Tax=Colletotrichum shisoi TaxID=2078593 RepID=A0A5Q4BJG3_9PEZI|nr:hypothetical protein CSHISOI_08343 [Colletotrichum shisoi]
MTFPGLNWKGSDYYPHDSSSARTVRECINRINEPELCHYASQINNNVPCDLLPYTTNGLHHLVSIIEFKDKTRWIARMQMTKSTEDTAAGLKVEVDTMSLLADQTRVPVPRVFGYQLTDENPIGAAFILMDFLPGNVAVDACGGYAAHQGEIPTEHRHGFYKSIARIQLEITSARLPNIGTVSKNKEGGYSVGPLPGIGGPFETASAFFKAWSKWAIFPKSLETIRLHMNGGPMEKVVAAINQFPSGIGSMAGRPSSLDCGPFPLVHRDFYHSNIIVDDEYHPIGIIDWEGACTLPWELVEFPLFLETLPATMDSPSNYDECGQPLDIQTRQRLRDRKIYAEMVARFEESNGMDSMLSSTLVDEKVQSLAYAVRVYLDPGKLGFYDVVLTEYTQRSTCKN